MFTNTDWRTGMQGASAVIDDKLGEVLRICPATKRANFSPTYDEADEIELRGVFSYRSEKAFDMKRAEQSAALMVETRKPIASFSAAALPWPLAQSYRITRAIDGTAYEVTNVEPDGVSRVTVHLVQLGRQRQ